MVSYVVTLQLKEGTDPIVVDCGEDGEKASTLFDALAPLGVFVSVSQTAYAYLDEAAKRCAPHKPGAPVLPAKK